MPIFKGTDRWQDVTDAHWREVEALPGIAPDCTVIVDARQFGEVTVWEAVEWLPSQPELFRWVVQNSLHLLDRPERLRLMEFVARDPLFAGAIYITVPRLTDEEDAILYAAFAPTMPKLVARLNDGTPGVRAKVQS
jgi:hypothetical protein